MNIIRYNNKLVRYDNKLVRVGEAPVPEPEWSQEFFTNPTFSNNGQSWNILGWNHSFPGTGCRIMMNTDFDFPDGYIYTFGFMTWEPTDTVKIEADFTINSYEAGGIDILGQTFIGEEQLTGTQTRIVQNPLSQGNQEISIGQFVYGSGFDIKFDIVLNSVSFKRQIN